MTLFPTFCKLGYKRITLCRWVNADTVMSVVAVQLFLNTLTPVSGVSVVGLCVATSAFYSVDRWIDATLAMEPLGQRHHLYARHPRLLLVTLGLYSTILLPLLIKLWPPRAWPLIAAGVVVHSIGLAYPNGYGPFKKWVVAAVFTLVMTAFIPPLYPALLVVFSATFINLSVHDMHERGNPLPDTLIVIASLGTVIGLHLLDRPLWLIGLWLASYSGYARLPRNDYWFEYGELVYALPFLTAALLDASF